MPTAFFLRRSTHPPPVPASIARRLPSGGLAVKIVAWLIFADARTGSGLTLSASKWARLLNCSVVVFWRAWAAVERHGWGIQVKRWKPNPHRSDNGGAPALLTNKWWGAGPTLAAVLPVKPRNPNPDEDAMLDEDEAAADIPTPGFPPHRHFACSHGRVGCIGCNKRSFCVHLWTKCRCAAGEPTTTRWEGEPAPVLADDDDRSHHPLKFRFVPLDLAHLAAEECTRSVLGAWVMPRQLLAPHLDEPVTLAWIAPSANPAWNQSRAASNPKLDAIETMLLAKRGDVVATVWRVHLLAARVRRDLWDVEDAREAGSSMPELVPLPRRHVDSLLQALAGVTRLSLEQIRQGAAVRPEAC